MRLSSIEAIALALHAAEMVEVAPGVELRIIRLETLLRMKAEAGRPQELADVAALRRIRGLDHLDASEAPEA